jgi:demethylmenaquinone methyltransferase/2-methoxy-6-polyprenyl-1,4-benzoquinol methylase/phosphoethanolamine N-methyltransferase
MSQETPQSSSIVIHRSTVYDLFLGRLIRTSDAEILARADVASGDRLLDVGTGPGCLALSAAKLVRPGGRAVGIDASPEMIARAQMVAARRRSEAEYLVATAESLPFEDDSFDVVVSRLVFHHLPGDLKQRALSEMARVLRPNGRLFVADLASPTAKHAHHLVAHVLGNRPDTGAALVGLISGAGFTQLTQARLMHGMLAGVAARSPERGAQG